MLTYAVNTSYMFKAVLSAIVVAFIMAWLGMKIARRLNIVDIPGSAPHKKHQKTTPLAGGLTLILSILILTFVSGLWQFEEILKVLTPAIIIFALGLWDDAFGMSAPPKLIGQIIAAIILILFGISIQIFETANFFISGTGFFYQWLDWVLTILWVVGVTNAFNLVDSMDGLAVGLSAWAFGFFMLAAFNSQQIPLSHLSALLLGICISINFFNARPARMFLGDSGAQTLGFIFAAIAILYVPDAAHQTSSWFVPILLVGVPIFDTTLVFFSRLRRKKPFYKGDLDHTYHRLVALGMDSGRAVQAMHITALLLQCIAFIALSLPPYLANAVFVVCLILGAGCFLWLDRKTLRR